MKGERRKAVALACAFAPHFRLRPMIAATEVHGAAVCRLVGCLCGG